jgi:outer membrane protein OmpA-like peptidoglycan-associated protein
MSVNAGLPDAFPPALPLAGEGAPASLVAALAVMGATLAVVSASMWLTPRAAQPEPVTIVVHEKEPPPPPTIVEVPVPAPAPPPTIIEVPAPVVPPPCFDPMTIMFATNQSVPLTATNAARERLHSDIARLKDWLGKHDGARVVVSGHSDSQGNEAHNLVLSFARAKAVSSLLASNGIPPARITVRAAGAAEAAAKADPRDRRADIGIEGIGPCKNAASATETP